MVVYLTFVKCLKTQGNGLENKMTKHNDTVYNDET